MFRAREGFAVFKAGTPRVIPAGTLVDPKDPLAVSHRHLMDLVEDYVSTRESRGSSARLTTETASVEPELGGRVAVSRPSSRKAVSS